MIARRYVSWGDFWRRSDMEELESIISGLFEGARSFTSRGIIDLIAQLMNALFATNENVVSKKVSKPTYHGGLPINTKPFLLT